MDVCLFVWQQQHTTRAPTTALAPAALARRSGGGASPDLGGAMPTARSSATSVRHLRIARAPSRSAHAATPSPERSLQAHGPAYPPEPTGETACLGSGWRP